MDYQGLDERLARSVQQGLRNNYYLFETPKRYRVKELMDIFVKLPFDARSEIRNRFVPAIMYADEAKRPLNGIISGRSFQSPSTVDRLCADGDLAKYDIGAAVLYRLVNPDGSDVLEALGIPASESTAGLALPQEIRGKWKNHVTSWENWGAYAGRHLTRKKDALRKVVGSTQEIPICSLPDELRREILKR